MKNKYLLCITFSSCFFYITGSNKHASYVLEKAQEQFGTKMSSEKYKALKESIVYKHEIIKESMYPNIAKKNNNYVKFDCHSKSGNTVLVYSAYKNKHGVGGFTDIIRLKENFYKLSELSTLKLDLNNESFKQFSFPIIASLKVWSKEHGLKIPKPLIDNILQYGYPYYDFDYDGPRNIISYTLFEKFNLYGYDFYEFGYSSLFVDDQKNIVINFKDKKNNNILYAQNKDSALQLLIVPCINTNKPFLIENPKTCKPGQIEIYSGEDCNQTFLIENSAICQPGEIKIDGIENNILTASKDDEKYTIII